MERSAGFFEVMERPARFLGTLAACLGLGAMVLAVPAWLRLGMTGLEGVAYAALATFVPGLLMVLISRRLQGPQRSLQLLLWGTALRVGFVLVVGMLVVTLRPAIKSTEFFLVLSLFYFIALAVETRHLLAELAPGSPRQSQ